MTTRRRLQPSSWISTRLAVCGLAGVCVLAVGVAWAASGRRAAVPPAVEPAAIVGGIYPTASQLPANLLRFYIVFSAPMSIGWSAAHLRLVDDGGQEVNGAFLRLEEELWDPSRRRLTVLLDPGRLKRGLRANLESGAPITEGRRYRLIVDAGWRDGDGHPLRAGAEKAFDVVSPDRQAPDVSTWELVAPDAGSREALVVRFPEPMDRALLAHALEVRDASGANVRGEVVVGGDEREWGLVPERPWEPGAYRLNASPEIEDVAGNNLRRLFDVDLGDTLVANRKIEPGDHVRTFTVRSKSSNGLGGPAARSASAP